MINLEEIRLFLATQGINLLRGIMVLVIGFVIVHWVFKLLDRSQKYTRIDPTIRGFLDNLIRIGLYIIVILTAVSIMGIPMTSVITLVASAGVASCASSFASESSASAASANVRNASGA